jgi:hypothetical protein
MALAIQLGALVTLCRQRAGREAGTGGDDTLDGPEWKSLIAEYYMEMHALIAGKGARYFEAEDTITASGAATYALPAAHFSTIGVEAFISGTSGPRRPVFGPIAVQERTRLMARSGPAVFHALEGANIALYPVPSSGTYRHIYIPQPTDYSASADSTSVDLINVYGRKFVIWGVASVAQHKGSESQERAMVETEKARAEIEYWAAQRALTQPNYRVPEDFDMNPLAWDAGNYLVTSS